MTYVFILFSQFSYDTCNSMTLRLLSITQNKYILRIKGEFLIEIW